MAWIPNSKAHMGIARNVTQPQLAALAAVLSDTVGEKEGRRAEQALQAVLPEQDERPARGS